MEKSTIVKLSAAYLSFLMMELLTLMNYLKFISFRKVKNYQFCTFPEKPRPYLIKNDYIGPPDKKTNLRPYIRSKPEREGRLAMKLRKKQIEVERWNQFFWLKHNKQFYEEKQEFIKWHNQSGHHEISGDKICEFYKAFLDKNQKVHILYNISWYIKNFEILLLAFQVAVQNIYKKLKH